MCPRKYHLVPDDPARSRRWRQGRYLPHWDGRFIPQFVTFRLNDSIPRSVLKRWREELEREPEDERKRILSKRIKKYTDQGYGSCVLEKPDAAQIVQDSLLYYDGERYFLHAWVLMPNHVHVLFTISGNFELGDIVHTWKSYSAQVINKRLDRSDPLWNDEYYDRYMRNSAHFWDIVSYIETNPVRAGLCDRPSAWRWNSAYYKQKGTFETLGSKGMTEMHRGQG